MSSEPKALRAFALAAGADSVDNAYYRFTAPVQKDAAEVHKAEVRRLVQKAQSEMRRLGRELPKD